VGVVGKGGDRVLQATSQLTVRLPPEMHEDNGVSALTLQYTINIILTYIFRFDLTIMSHNTTLDSSQSVRHAITNQCSLAAFLEKTLYYSAYTL
jgi:hypothetical protein